MENVVKIECSNSTYVCSSHPNNNFCKEEKLFIASVNENTSNINIYKAIVSFYISELDFNSLKNIYLFLFIENMYNKDNIIVTISTPEDNKDLNISDINWSTAPDKNIHDQINVAIPNNAIGRYVKIDISNIIQYLNSYSGTYNLIIEPTNYNLTSIIQASSNNSIKPPYLNIVIDTKDTINNNSKLYNFDERNHGIDYKINSNHYTNNIDKDINYGKVEKTYSMIISELNNQSLKLASLEENLTKLCNSLDTVTSKEKSNEIFTNLKDSLDNDMLKFKNVINNDILSFKNSIKDISETLLTLSKQVNKVCGILENVIIDPIDDKSIK